LIYGLALLSAAGGVTVQILKQLLIMLLMFLPDAFNLGFDLRVLAFLGVMMAFFESQQFPGHLILQIVQVFGGQWHFDPSFLIQGEG
jgi:hypothetical protein